jgi:Predicted oxidoreductases of the aldo/keto reductase family
MMYYRRFGRTELPMPVFSCGGMRYQHQWQDTSFDQIPEANQKEVEASIYRALELGINHIETARAYGTSEMQLGKVLPKIPRERLIVQTKVCSNSDPLKFKQNFDQSLAYLQLDHVDLFGIHGINNPESFQDTIKPGGCLAVAKQLKAEGKVRFIGFSSHAATDLIIQAIETNEFDYVNLHWYYINQNNWSAIEAATRHDMGVFIISPSNKGGQLYQPPEKLLNLCSPLSPMVFNDLFCLSHPQVHTLSIGASKATDFDEHLKTIPLLDRWDEILPPIQKRLEQELVNCLGENWVKTWDIGLPNHKQTPNNINIPVILWLRNLAIAYDMIDYAKMRYNLLGSAGDWFPGKNAEGVENLDLSQCLVNSPHADQIPHLLAETHQLLKGETVLRLSKS